MTHRERDGFILWQKEILSGRCGATGSGRWREESDRWQFVELLLFFLLAFTKYPGRLQAAHAKGRRGRTRLKSFQMLMFDNEDTWFFSGHDERNAKSTSEPVNQPVEMWRERKALEWERDGNWELLLWCAFQSILLTATTCTHKR